MDNKNYNQALMEQLSLLRDLLIVIEQGGNKTPDILYTLAIEKSQQITSMVQARRDEMQPSAVTIPDDYPLWLDDATSEDVDADGDENIDSERQLQDETDIENERTVQECNAEECNDLEVKSEDRPCDEAASLLIDDEEINPLDEEHIATDGKDCHSPVNSAFLFEEETDEHPIQHESDSHIDVSNENNHVINDDIDLTTNITDTTESGVIADNTCKSDNEGSSPSVDDDMDVENRKEKGDMAVGDDIAVAEILLSDDSIEMLDNYIDEEDEYVAVGEEYDVVEVAEPEDNWYNRGQTSNDDETVMTIGDKLTLHRAKELRKALSFNDRFRYRRELFGNKDVEMNNTLNLIDAMSDYAEACEYLLQDLGWSAEEPVVKEFLELVERHFKQQ
ncbi:MAG: hypothetical protein IKM35_03675 [Bacteroidaceae bacterium]|nr:hypothetical protein [Bacteroidaceae bacterium]